MRSRVIFLELLWVFRIAIKSRKAYDTNCKGSF